jgi:hypothetical protein
MGFNKKEAVVRETNLPVAYCLRGSLWSRQLNEKCRVRGQIKYHAWLYEFLALLRNSGHHVLRLRAVQKPMFGNGQIAARLFQDLIRKRDWILLHFGVSGDELVSYTRLEDLQVVNLFYGYLLQAWHAR